jgi:hypothetical protein
MNPPLAFTAELQVATDLDRLLTHRLLETTPYLFGEDHAAYVDWRSELGALLGVDPHAIALVGSAALGVSLNPAKNLKPFDAASDVDVAVVSSFHFDVAWQYLRSLGARIYQLPYWVQLEITDRAPNYVYWGAIATDRILGHLPFGADWLVALAAMTNRDPTMGRKVNARLYRDLAGLRSYQLRGLRIARDRLVSGGDGGSE